MNIKLSRITKSSLLEILDERESYLSSLRTSDFILDNQQESFYESLSKRTDIKLYNIYEKDGFFYYDYESTQESLGICGFVNFNSINRNAEISLILKREFTGQGLGEESLNALLDHGFNHLNLKNIYGEVYNCSKSLGFWKKMILKKEATSSVLPQRKFFKGKYYDSIYFNFSS